MLIGRWVRGAEWSVRDFRIEFAEYKEYAENTAECAEFACWAICDNLDSPSKRKSKQIPKKSQKNPSTLICLFFLPCDY